MRQKQIPYPQKTIKIRISTYENTSLYVGFFHFNYAFRFVWVSMLMFHQGKPI